MTSLFFTLIDYSIDYVIHNQIHNEILGILQFKKCEIFNNIDKNSEPENEFFIQRSSLTDKIFFWANIHGMRWAGKKFKPASKACSSKAG